MTEHHLKTHPEYFKNIQDESKGFDLRKNDRDYQVGDIAVLWEYDPKTNELSGESKRGLITYILQDCPKFGLKKGFCILSLNYSYHRNLEDEKQPVYICPECGMIVRDNHQIICEDCLNNVDDKYLKHED